MPSGAKAKDLTGQRFGRLTVVDRAPNSGEAVAWNTVCDCGTHHVARGHNLRRGGVKSCGCWNRERSRAQTPASYRHGLSRTPIYALWRGMVQRCTKPSFSAYKWYGARGITVCDRWLSFENFLSDMGERPPGMSLDRIDNTKGYSPENCRWATDGEQARNRRGIRMLEHDGRVMCLADWARELGLAPTSLDKKLRTSTLAEVVAKPRVTPQDKNPLVGAHFDKANDRWQSAYRKRYLGVFATPEEAHAAYMNAREQVTA